MKEKITKLLSFLKKGAVAPTGTNNIKPNRDWNIVLGIFLVILMCISFANYVYYYSDLSDMPQSDTPAGPKLKVGQIEEVASYIKAKQVRYETIVNSPLPSIDPS
jgi:hypothetical protein